MYSARYNITISDLASRLEQVCELSARILRVDSPWTDMAPFDLVQ